MGCRRHLLNPSSCSGSDCLALCKATRSFSRGILSKCKLERTLGRMDWVDQHFTKPFQCSLCNDLLFSGIQLQLRKKRKASRLDFRSRKSTCSVKNKCKTENREVFPRGKCPEPVFFTWPNGFPQEEEPPRSGNVHGSHTLRHVSFDAIQTVVDAGNGRIALHNQRLDSC